MKKSSAENIISEFNVENAKLVALLLVIGFIAYHGVLHLQYGPDSCTWLLSSGRYKGDHEWQPYGCMLHKYSKTDARRCLRYLAFWEKDNTFAFIGDSRLQQLSEHFIDVFKTKYEPEASMSTVEHHSNQTSINYVDKKLKLSVMFVWSPYVSRTMVDQFRFWQKSDKPPSLIVASTGLDIIKERNTTEYILDEYRRNLTHLVQAIDSLAARSSLVLWKLLEPVDSSKLSNEYKKISNTDIDAYNNAAVEILTHSSSRIWSSPSLVSLGAPPPDGYTISPLALTHSAQILLNMYCNDHMNFNDGSCCAQPEGYTRLQMVTFGIFVGCIAVAAMKWAWQWTQTCQQRFKGYAVVNEKAANPSPVAALAKLGMLMFYFYLCDRTNFFMKENKYYSEWSFWLPVGYVFALGLFFTEDSKYNRVLHREQTDEWKGWMQCVILIYQVTGASKVLPMYMLIRAVVSSYLFLTGFGHLYYTWNTPDTTILRYFRVIFRLNFLTVVLCLAMNRHYQFYSFIPLVSFWFTLMFVIFSLPPHISGVSTQTVDSMSYQYLYVAIKVIGLLTIVTVLYMSEVFFQKIFVTRPWKALFVNSDDDIHQWWLDWKQDRYSMAYGIVFGIAYLLAKRYKFLDDNNHKNLFTPGISLSATLLAFIGLGSYLTFIFLCNNVYDCNEIHSYVAFIPIISYILLRNVSGALRTKYSSLFASIGTFSLELFVCQSHIWLAADTHGVLVLIPSAPVLNLIVTTFIFVCAAHELRQLTCFILPYAVPDDWRLALRNLAVFMVVLVPIGIHDGMF